MPEQPKNKKRSVLYLGNIEDMAERGEYITPEILQESAKKRQDWNDFVAFLTEKGVVGSPNLDKTGAGTAYLNMWNKMHPEKSLSNDDIRAVQEFARKKIGSTGIRVTDGVLGQVTSTFKFPSNETNTYTINPNTGEKVLVKSEDANVGNYTAKADQLNFAIAVKRGEDVSKLPIYNPNSARVGVNLGAGYEELSQKATEALKKQTEMRAKTGRSFQNPQEFVKPIVATEQHPATQTQKVGNPFEINRQQIATEDISKGITQGKEATQQRVEYVSEIQKKFKDPKVKLTPDEAVMYYQETGKLAPSNRVAGKYKRDEKGNILDASGQAFTQEVNKKALRAKMGKDSFGDKMKELIPNIKRGAQERIAYNKELNNKGIRTAANATTAGLLAGGLLFPPTAPIAIPTAIGYGLFASTPGVAIQGGIKGAVETFKTPKGKNKKPIRTKNKSFVAPVFE
jgi:hypothetical protein